jgi:hypothetical protein
MTLFPSRPRPGAPCTNRPLASAERIRSRQRAAPSPRPDLAPNEPEARRHAAPPPARLTFAPKEPEPDPIRAADGGKTMSARSARRATDSQGRMDLLNRCRTYG